MGRVAGPVFALAIATVAALVATGCSAVGGPSVTAEQRAWCVDHELPDLAGGPSVAGSARDLRIASADVERTLAALDATTAEGARLTEEAVKAQVLGDAAGIAAAQEALRAWESGTAAPARAALAAALGAWSSSPEWAEACGHAYERRGTTSGSPEPTLPPEASAEPTEEPTAEPTEEPTPRLTANKTINYTSETSVGRLIELTIKVRNPGPLEAGRLSVQVEGVDYAIAERTPIVGCIPDCKTATGPEGIGFVEWPAPEAGKSHTYVVQLKAKRSGSYDLEVRVYRGPAGDPLDELASWSIDVRVR